MAQKVIVEHVDDLDGKSLADETGVHIGLDGVDYEIDLSKDNADRLRDSLSEYIDAARRVGRKQRSGGPGRVTAKIANDGDSDRPDPRKVREWAAHHGVELAAYGRIPRAIQEEYLNANA